MNGAWPRAKCHLLDMAGVGIEGYEGRVPCPYCESSDCCGIEWEGEPNAARDNCYTICSQSGRRFKDEDLLASAARHGLRRHLHSIVPDRVLRHRPSALAERR